MSGPGQLQPNQISVGSIHVNTEQTLISITEDRLRLALMGHLGAIESKNRWHVPLGVILALVPVLLTSEFKEIMGVDKATWKAFFMFALIGGFVWMLFMLRFAFASASMDKLIQKIKNDAAKT